jgi:hypothetical protein
MTLFFKSLCNWSGLAKKAGQILHLVAQAFLTVALQTRIKTHRQVEGFPQACATIEE